MQITLQELNMTYPSGKQALKGLRPKSKIPQPHRPAGPQRGWQIHPDEAVGGGLAAHRGIS